MRGAGEEWGVLPEEIGAEQGVGRDDEFARDGGEGGFGVFAAQAELRVEGAQGWVAAECGDGVNLMPLIEGGATAKPRPIGLQTTGGAASEAARPRRKICPAA